MTIHSVYRVKIPLILQNKGVVRSRRGAGGGAPHRDADQRRAEAARGHLPEGDAGSAADPATRGGRL